MNRILRGGIPRGSITLLSVLWGCWLAATVWADDETGCYGVRGRDAKGKWIVVERSGPIRIVSARR